MSKESLKNNIELIDSAEFNSKKDKVYEKDTPKYKENNRPIIIALILLVLSYAFSILFFVTAKGGNKNLAFLFNASYEKFMEFISYIGGTYSVQAQSSIVIYTSILICGAVLAVVGAVFQGGFRNIIASPSTMGVQSGATLGNAVYLLLFTIPTSETVVIHQTVEESSKNTFWQSNIQQLCAVLGAFIAISCVVGITYLLGKGRFSSANILFSGMIFSTLVGSIVSIIQYYFMYVDPDDSRWRSLRELTMGSFDKIITCERLVSLSVVLIPCLIILTLISRRLNALSFGEEEAISMGVDVKRLKRVVIGIGSLMTGVVLAFCGQIGFVGFIVPQISRRLVGSDFKRIIIMSMIIGALLMIWVYNIASALGFSQYLNMITSVIGCSMMLYAFLSKRRMQAI